MDGQSPGRHVRPMAEGDLGVVASMHANSFLSSDHPGRKEGDHESSLREELARPWTRVWVAHTGDDVPRAFLVTWFVAGELHVLNIATEPAYRRKGLAEALMREALRYLRQEGGTSVFLEVRCSNEPALSLYRSLGFFMTNTRRGYYDDGEDAIEMALHLDPGTGEVVPPLRR